MAKKRFDVLKEIAAHLEGSMLDGVSAHLAIDEARTKFSHLMIQVEDAARQQPAIKDSPFYRQMTATQADFAAKRYDRIPNACRALASAAQAHQ